MGRHLRSFTLSPENSEAVDRIHASNITAPEVQVILQILEAAQPSSQKPETDEADLTAEDYVEIYKLFPPERVSYFPKYKHLWKSERLPSIKVVFRLALQEVTLHDRRAFFRDVQEEVKRRQRYNRKWKPKRTTMNASRIVDTLIGLGLQVLNERVASLGAERSKGKDAGESTNKLPHAGRRKTAKVSAL